MHEKVHHVPPGFMIFQKILPVSKRFELVSRGSMRF